MDAKQLVAIIIKLFAIGLVIYVLNSATNIVALYGIAEYQKAFYFQAGSSLCVLAVAALLWIFPLSLAAKVIPSRSQQSTTIGSVSYIEMRAICFTILGLYLSFNVISDIVYWGSYLAFFDDVLDPVGNIPAYDKASIVATGIEAIMAVLLLVGRDGLDKLFFKIRYSG